MPARECGASTPSILSANSIWRARVRAFADRKAFSFRRADVWESLTWKQADGAASEIAAGLLTLGLAPGDRVALLCQTRLEWVLCDVAIAMAGLVSVPIFPSSTSEQCAFLLRDSGADTIIAEDGQQVEKLGVLRARHPTLRIIRVEDASPTQPATQAEDANTPLALAQLRQAGAAWLAANPGELER
ncbi:MAG TPA: AMP-binding protein, partial [Polyangia bacterium]